MFLAEHYYPSTTRGTKFYCGAEETKSDMALVCKCYRKRHVICYFDS